MRVRRRRIRKTIAIIVMLVLCIAAIAYIIKLVNSRDQAVTTADESVETEAVTEEQEAVADTAEDLEDEEDEESNSSTLQHVYSYSGKPDEEKYSYAAYDSAIEAGAGSIVLAYVVSADGTPYVADDDYAADRTGIQGYFSGMTDSQIDDITTRAGGKVIKLRDVFEKYGKSVNYIIEVRYISDRNIQVLADTVKELGYEDNVTASCLYYEGLNRLEKVLPDVPKLFLCQDQAGFNSALPLSYVDAISVDKSIMTEENCTAAHDNDKKFGAWTLSSEEEIKKAIDLGVDSYYTDNTELAASVEKE